MVTEISDEPSITESAGKARDCRVEVTRGKVNLGTAIRTCPHYAEWFGIEVG